MEVHDLTVAVGVCENYCIKAIRKFRTRIQARF